jgi:hypothetical protein
MPRVADLVEGVNQYALLFGLECDIEVNGGTGGCVAQSLPVDWNGMPGVLDLHVIPRFDGRREVSEEHGSEEGEGREPVETHVYKRSATNVRFRRVEV